MPEGKAVCSMFGEIAGRYDLANHALSFGVDFYWRKQVVDRVARLLRERPEAGGQARVVDLATGSGDLAFALKDRLGHAAEVIGMDFCQPMLDEAERKQAERERPAAETIAFRQGDVLDLPLESDSVDVCTIAFGLRNLEDRARGLREIFRVLKKPHGSLIVLEFTQPDDWFKPAYYFYLRSVLPRLARAVTGNRSAYEYLGGTISEFPEREALRAEIAAQGFASVTYTALSAGIVAIHYARTGTV